MREREWNNGNGRRQKIEENEGGSLKIEPSLQKCMNPTCKILRTLMNSVLPLHSKI